VDGEKPRFVSKFLCIGEETRNEAENGSENHVFIGVFEDFKRRVEVYGFWQDVYIWFMYIWKVRIPISSM